MSTKNIVWLASYPKSGNTWTRAFLMNYFMDPEKPLPINELHRFSNSDANTSLYSKVAGQKIDPTNHQVAMSLRPRVLNAIAGNGADINLVKSHNINDIAYGQPLIPANLTRTAVYILRNPLDMVLSYSRHFGMTIDKTIYAIGNKNNASKGDDSSVPQYMGKWSDHVLGWTRTRNFPVHVMRYEDMLAKPQESFGKLLSTLGFPLDDAKLAKAIEFSSFKELKRQESSYGFIEQSSKNENFFHSGQSDQWKSDLTAEQIAKVRQDHGKVMQKYGYF
ncbi:MAG: sulfotransferase domain-containing protein [Pseudomonadota bacterium]